jgi:hypothetical protein
MNPIRWRPRPALAHYFNDGMICIDNSAAERVLRGAALIAAYR